MDETSIKNLKIGGLKFFPQDAPADREVQSEILRLWQSKRSFIILSGPPGVGKTRASEDLVLEMLKCYDAPHGKETCRITSIFPDFKVKVYAEDEIESALTSSQIKLVWDVCVLHPQYTYEDLIRGYLMNPSEGGMPRLEVREGILGFIARVVSIMEQINLKSDYPLGILILDEINRAPIGQLFGEGLYALDRRGKPVATPYNLVGVGNNLVVPESLLLLGTMNSVDRAVSGFDFALRRRFVTITMVPSQTSIDEHLHLLENAKTVAVELYKRIKNLILKSSQTGTVPLSELVIGHSYFLPPSIIKDDDSAIMWLAESYQYQILPTLVDYQEQGLLEFRELDMGDVPGAEALLGRKSLGEIRSEDIALYLQALSASS